MIDADNIETATADVEPVDKEARRKEDACQRAAASRLAKKRALPADAATVAETIVLCMMDLQTLPPSKRDARGQVIADVMRQCHLTLEAMGHPEVHASIMDVVHSVRDRLQSEKWHHPLRTGAFRSTPVTTPVTPTARGASAPDGIAVSTHGTDGVRAE